MAKRILKAQIKPVTCKLQTGVDYEITKPNLALTPQNIKDLTDRGIAVNLPNEKQFLEGDSISSAKSWDIEPVFSVPLICVNFGNLNRFPKIKCLRHIKLINVNLDNYATFYF